MSIPVYESAAATNTKANTASIVSGDITTENNECLLIYLTFKGTDIPTEVRYGLRDMHKVFHRIDTANSFGHALYILRRVTNGRTDTVTVTFPASITVKSITPITVPVELIYDTHLSVLDENSGAPSATITDTLQESDELVFGFAVGENSTNQVSPTFTGWTNLVDGSTVGVPTAGNNHWIVGYKNLTSADNDVSYAGSGGDSTDWITTVVAFKEIAKIASDKNFSTIEIGDPVEYNSTSYTVTDIDENINVVELDSTIRVGGSYVELI